MESQSSQPSLLRQTIAGARPTAIAAAVATPATTPAYAMPLELMVPYHNARPVLPSSMHMPNCIFSNQLCACVYGSQTCTIPHAPIAYGQASSSFVAPTTSTAAAASIPPPGLAEPSISTHRALDPTSLEMARRDTRLPQTFLNPQRAGSRLKRPAPPLPPQVADALETAERERASKLRRLPSDSGSDIQTVGAETVPQTPASASSTPETPLPPSTSQLVTGPVPSTHSSCTRCHGSSPQCGACSTNCTCTTPALIPYAPHRATIVQPTASRHNYVLPPVPQAQLPHIFPNTNMAQTMSSVYNPHAQTIAVDYGYQNRMRQQQMLNNHNMLSNAVHQHYRLTYLTNGQLYVPVRTTPMGLEALLVNVTHPEFLLDRPLDRHHMFAGPISEPQPIGCSLQDIEKYSEKLQFVKDCQLPETEQERCIVCQCELETGEEVRHLTCSHQFHVECIDRWLGYNKKCPVCRLDIDQPKSAKDADWIDE